MLVQFYSSRRKGKEGKRFKFSPEILDSAYMVRSLNMITSASFVILRSNITLPYRYIILINILHENLAFFVLKMLANGCISFVILTARYTSPFLDS